MKKVFSLNCIQSRFSNLELILPNILCQTDILYINLIGTKKILYKFNNDKIRVNTFYNGGSELRFFNYDDCDDDTYYFTIDDDIVYPIDYSDKLIENMINFNNKVVCCVHGCNIDLSLNKNFLNLNRKVFHFKNALETNRKIMIPGVGTCCFYTGTVKINILNFEISNMSDIYICSFLYKQKIPVISIKRNNMWLKPLNTNDKTIWGNNPYNEIDNLILQTFKND
jgi:hypothetical protein